MLIQTQEVSMDNIIYLSPMPEYDAYGIEEQQIKELIAHGKTPQILFSPSTLKQFGQTSDRLSAPTIAFVMGIEDGKFLIKKEYAQDLIQTGSKIKFLIPDINADLKDVHGLVLPDRLGKSWSHICLATNKKNCTKVLDWFYEDLIKQAEKNNIPILAFADGAQIIGNIHNFLIPEPPGIKLGVEKREGITIYPESELYQILGYSRKLKIRTNKTAPRVNPALKQDFKIYAVTDDGYPQAWGSALKNIMCLQWKPEDSESDSRTNMESIYSWLAAKAKTYQKRSRTVTPSEARGSL